MSTVLVNLTRKSIIVSGAELTFDDLEHLSACFENYVHGGGDAQKATSIAAKLGLTIAAPKSNNLIDDDAENESELA